MRDDDGDVAQVEGRRGDAEDGDYRLLACYPNQVETATEADDEPDCVYGCICRVVDAAPET